jgi:methionyl-tRNA formyltransferase
MRVVSFGFPTWGFSTRRALIELDHEVALAVAHPASERSDKAIFSQPVEQLTRDHDIPVHRTERVDAGTTDLVERVPRTESSPAGEEFFVRGGYLNDRA